MTPRGMANNPVNSVHIISLKNLIKKSKTHPAFYIIGHKSTNTENIQAVLMQISYAEAI